MKIKLRFIGYLVNCVFIILTMTTVYHVNHSEQTSLIAGLFLVTDLLYILFVTKKMKLKHSYVLFLFIYVIVAFMYCILKNNNHISCFNVLFLSNLGYFLFIYLLKQSNEELIFFKILIRIAFWIALVSIFCWIFVTKLEVFKPTGVVYLQWGKGTYISSFFNIYYMPQYGRNSAIFAEGPAANYFFFSMLLLNEFYIGYRLKLYNTVFIIAIITTLTTTGQIGLILFLSYKLMGMKGEKKVFFAIKSIGIIIGAVGGLLILKTIFEGKLETGSGIIRLNMMRREIVAFIRNPILGEGFCAYTEGSSNSITSLLADGGIVLWGMYYGPQIFLLMKEFLLRRKINWFVLIYMCIFAVSVFHFTILSGVFWAIFWNMILLEGKRGRIKNEYLYHNA